MELHERIRAIRKDAGLTQEEFGKRIGVGRGVIANLELNVLKKPEQKEPIIRLICKEFDISELWLRENIGSMKRELSRDEAIVDWAATLVKDEEANMSEEILFAKKFANVLSQLSAEDWKTLAKMARMMVEDIKE